MDKKLQQTICDAISDNSGYEGYKCLEYIEKVEVNGVTYYISEEEELDTTDEGKYQFGATVYRIINDKEDKYFFVKQDFYQTGSYYSYQERTYEQPYIVQKVEVKTYKWKAI